MNNRLALSVAALLAASTTAFAQAPDKANPGPNGGAAVKEGTPSAGGSGKSSEAPSAKQYSPGEMKGEGESARDVAPGREKDSQSARDDAPGHKKDAQSADRDSKDAKDGNDRADKDGGKDSAKSGGATGASEGTSGKEGKPSGNLAEIPSAKKTEVRSAFSKHRVEPARNLNISVNVGVAVPHSLTLYAVPEDVVVIYPAYSHYKYFLIDDRICIVDPATFEIVEIIVVA